MAKSVKLIRFEQFRVFFLEGLFVLLLALALGHAGPYGTYQTFDWITRLAYWLTVIIVPWAISKSLFFFAKKYAPEELSITYITVLLIPVIAIIGSALTTFINLQVGLHNDQGFFQVWPFSILVWLAFAFFILLPMISIARTIAKEQRKSGVSTMMAFFHHKLPSSLADSQLIALKAEDHYLRVITNNGNALILMRFSDALSALNGYPGVQTHRSWWVASSQLKQVAKLSGATTSILLDDGTQVPISRRKRKLVNNHIENLRSHT